MEEKTKTEPTVEQYKNFIEALKSQNTQLIYQLQNANLSNMFKRLDYLFKVIENSTSFNKDFVNSCIEEIKSLMTPPEEDKTKDNEVEA